MFDVAKRFWDATGKVVAGDCELIEVSELFQMLGDEGYVSSELIAA